MTPGGRATASTDPWRYFITPAYPEVLSSTQPFKIVLVWQDTAEAANANPTLVNNLNLKVKIHQITFTGEITFQGVNQPLVAVLIQEGN